MFTALRVQHAGKRDDLLDETYPQKYLPRNLINRMVTDKAWTDEDKFHWGWSRLYGNVHLTQSGMYECRWAGA